MLTPEPVSSGIAKMKESESASRYVIPCVCSCEEHTQQVWVEYDDETDDVTVTTFVTLKTNFWSKSRWSHIWKLLTKGYVEYEGSTIMDRQTAVNYSDVLAKAANQKSS